MAGHAYHLNLALMRLFLIFYIETAKQLDLAGYDNLEGNLAWLME
jgi:hypothetical protein